MMDNEEPWILYRDVVLEKINLNVVLKTSESVCSAVGLKLAKLWQAYLNELLKIPWTSIFLTSLEPEGFGDDLQIRILNTLYYRPCGLKWKNFSDQPEEIEFL